MTGELKEFPLSDKMRENSEFAGMFVQQIQRILPTVAKDTVPFRARGAVNGIMVDLQIKVMGPDRYTVTFLSQQLGNKTLQIIHNKDKWWFDMETNLPSDEEIDDIYGALTTANLTMAT